MADAASQVLLGSGLTVLSQPLMYVKVLVQVGYEPLPPTLGRNVFGRQVYQLPGLFAYAKHIVKVDGRAGLFKGLAPRLCSSAVGTVVHGKVLQRYQEAEQAEVGAFFASMLTYPFVLVSNLMAVNNCGLAGGLLPYAPTYSSWLDCWSQLHREGNMSRGNSLFFRKVPAGKRYVWEERRFR
ncbi:LOW QUALITY PROTEIN: mitochondrial carrier homolog 2 [Gavia stellata]|uniref:LOW QUALITY PROTEIN: mitochondrial carrier homolog 2 n=1 Tax=Gavia stellata TaxID=37040 RepID=UPI0028994FD8|nr:LOW QUALITY PROTEIN: mitochondrial carrier homolog 2 [Gavia stellata]